MALIVVTSAAGSPGVSTAALGLAMAWPRPVVLIDADPTGSAAYQAGYFRGADLGHDPTILDLLVSHRDGTLGTDLPRMLMTIPETGVRFLPGLLSPAQSASMKPVWGPLCPALRTLSGSDVIVDAGRLGLFGSPDPVLLGADLALLVTRTDMVSLSGARSWAETLRERFARAGAFSALGVVLVGEGRPFRAREVASVLQLPVVTTIAWDPSSAAVLSTGAEPPRPGLGQRLAGRGGWEDMPLLRSLRGARSAITGRIRIIDEQLQAAGRGPV